MFTDLPDDEMLLALSIRPESLPDSANWCAQLRELVDRVPATSEEAEEISLAMQQLGDKA